MNDLVLENRAADWRRLKALVLDSVSSPITKVYNLGADEFIGWYGPEHRPGLTKATVNAWRGALEARGLGSVPINVRITAVQKLAVEAADNGLPEQMFFYGQTDSGYGRGRRLSMDGTSRDWRHARICERLGVKFPGATRRASGNRRPDKMPKVSGFPKT